VVRVAGSAAKLIGRQRACLALLRRRIGMAKLHVFIVRREDAFGGGAEHGIALIKCPGACSEKFYWSGQKGEDFFKAGCCIPLGLKRAGSKRLRGFYFLTAHE